MKQYVNDINSNQGRLPNPLTLSPQEYALLKPFYRAYRPHTKPQTWRQLRRAGLKPIKKDSLSMKYIIETTDSINN